MKRLEYCIRDIAYRNNTRIDMNNDTCQFFW